ncbi:hypothetical protein Taro_051399 [Colocasia esculenta]|uniref:Uncharacterized protein n=1 Tax=Colocasia esculenta TaxID=4460 RepID=A0A843XFV0_COLES|nr:hypothetical protein [Colocasia esculenta]
MYTPSKIFRKALLRLSATWWSTRSISIEESV